MWVEESHQFSVISNLTFEVWSLQVQIINAWQSNLWDKMAVLLNRWHIILLHIQFKSKYFKTELARCIKHHRDFEIKHRNMSKINTDVFEICQKLRRIEYQIKLKALHEKQTLRFRCKLE